ncbi:MAG: IPT/TIG domain-containing protein [Actinomycetota bacterium]|nr:IPT/TIG domain-containing protein [Actinomycetota bacterium]
MKSFAKRLRGRPTRLSLAYLVILTLIASIGVSVGTQSQAFALPNPLAQTNTITNSSYVITSTWCAPSSFKCFAVGYDNATGLAAYGSLTGSTWNFSDFTQTTGGQPNYSRLNSISCVDETHCVAVGVFLNSLTDVSTYSPEKSGAPARELVLEFTSGTWTDASVGFNVQYAPYSSLNSVACSSSSCFVVGAGAGDSGLFPVIEQVSLDNNGAFTSPQILGTPRNFTNGVATNIACTTTSGASECYVLGLQSPDYDLDGANVSFSFDPTNTSASQVLTDATYLPTRSQGTSTSTTDEVFLAPQGISCPTSTSCVGIFNTYNLSSPSSSIYVMNGPNSWSIAAPNVTASEFGASHQNDNGFSLSSIDCTTSTLCLVGGSASSISTSPSTPENPLLMQVDLSTTNPTFTSVDFSQIPSSTPTSLLSTSNTGKVQTGAITCEGTFNCTIFSSFQGTEGNPDLYESYVGAVPFANPPTISSASLSSQFSNEGFTVTISGSNLNEASGVTFGGVPGTNLQVTNGGTTLSANFAAQNAGSYSVAVDYPGGSITYGSREIIANPPTINSANISNDFSNQGFTLTVNGNNLSGVTSANFGSATGTNLAISNDGTSLTADFGAMSSGNYQVTLNYPVGRSVTYATNLSIINPPTINSVSPAVAFTGSSGTITINGSNLDTVTSIQINGKSATNLAHVSSQEIQASYSSLALGNGEPVVVTYGNNGQTITYTNGINVVNPPALQTISTSTLFTGSTQTVTISGTNLNYATGVSIGESKDLTFTVNNGGTSATATFQNLSSGPNSLTISYPTSSVVYPNEINVEDPPTITAATVSNDYSNQDFTLKVNGTNLGSVTSVDFGSTVGAALSISNDGTTLTANFTHLPVGNYSVVANYPDGSISAGSTFVILDPPTIDTATISSQFSNKGFTLTVTGKNLGSVTGASFGGATGTNISISQDGTTLTEVFPPQKAGAYPIVLNYPIKQSVAYPSDFTILDPPAINGISPTTAVQGATTKIVITGTNLNEVSNLIVAQSPSSPVVNSPNHASNTPVLRATTGTNPVSNYNLISSNQIDASVNFPIAGNYIFELIYPGGIVMSNPGAPFTILSPPQISGISPASTTSNVKTLITVNGANLNQVTSITVGGATVTSFNLVSGTTITFDAPSLPSGSYPIVLNFNGGQISSSGYSLQVTQPSASPSQIEPTTITTLAPSTPVSAPSLAPTTVSTTLAPTTTTQPSTTTSVLSASAPSQPQPKCAISGLCAAPIISGTYQFTSSNGQSFDLSIAPTATKGVYTVTAPSGAGTTMTVSGANFSFTNSSLITSFPGGVELVGLSEQNGILVGHFIQNGASTYSFTAKFVSSALFGKAPQVQIASIALTLPSPGKVFKSAKRDLFNVLLAIILVLYISFTSEFFNAALGEKYEEFRRAMRRKLTASHNKFYRQLNSLFFNSDVVLPQSVWTVAIVLAIGATIGIFLDPAAGLNLATVYSWLAIAISVSLGPTVSALTQNTYRKLHGMSSEFRLRAIPLGLFIALIAVSVSRFIHFKPGYLYGIVIGVVYYDKVKEHQEGHISTLNGTITLAVGLIAWLLWIPVHAYTIKQTGATFISFIDDILASTFVSSIVGSLVTSLPVGALPGKKIYKWHRGAWLGFMTTVIFLLVSVAATPLSSSAASDHSPLIAIVVAVLFLGGLALALARIFLRIEEREEILEELEEEELVHQSHSEELESFDTETEGNFGHES